jgi:2-oxoglutarate ferredoxin oxidoreductase subunit alpha
MGINFMEGNEAIARGALAAGCRFFAGYPITPATTIFNTMLQLLPPSGGICLQGEDEIASMGFCLGASMGGLKVMTATSGPGLSLYSEQISFAVGSEIPIVIINVQRLGPSTGSATRGADGDIQFMRWGNSGGLPVIVLAPVDLSDCYLLTAHAFNLAETYRCPVFIAANKEISMTRESVDLQSLALPVPCHRAAPVTTEGFMPFAADPGTGVPGFLPMGGEVLVRQTSSTHGAEGYITVDPGQIGRNQARLVDKLESAVQRFTFYEADWQTGAETLLVAYGVTARAAVAAVARLRSQGRPVSLLVLKTLWPVPEALISRALADHRRVVVVEMNMGQYVREIRRLAGAKAVVFLGQMNGELIRPEQIMEVIIHG